MQLGPPHFSKVGAYRQDDSLPPPRTRCLSRAAAAPRNKDCVFPNFLYKACDWTRFLPGGFLSLKLKAAARSACHAVLVIFGWILFFSWWVRVLSSASGKDIGTALAFISLTLAATVVVTLVWVRYNIGIFRRKGPRRTVTKVDERYESDVLGRRVVGPDIATLRRAPTVEVSLDDGAKRFASPGGN